MPAVPPRPSVHNLHRFLLGTLPPAEAEAVAAWVESSPDAARALAGIAAHDALTKAVATTAGVKPPPEPVVARVVANVAGAHVAAPEPESDAGDRTRPAVAVPSGGVPERIGSFRVVRELGRGGMGVVYEAVQEPLGRKAAVKVLGPTWAANREARERFLREARTAADLAPCAHVVTIYDVGEADDGPFLAMEFIEGVTLETWRRSRSEPVTAADVVWAARDLLAGLAAAHAKGFVHRDVKPANVMVERATGRIKILDFGLTRAAGGGEQLTSAGRVLGTPSFMSPEQASGKPADPRSDVFSVGVTLYALVTGRSPFTRADSAMATLFAVVNEPAPPLVDLPAPLVDFVARLLSKSPDDRPRDAGAALAELRAIEARLSTPLELEPALPPRRKPWGLLAAVAVLLCVATVVVIVRGKKGDEVVRVTVSDDKVKGGTVDVIGPNGEKNSVTIPPGKGEEGAPKPPKPLGPLGLGSRVKVTSKATAFERESGDDKRTQLEPGTTGKVVEFPIAAQRCRVQLNHPTEKEGWVLKSALEPIE